MEVTAQQDEDRARHCRSPYRCSRATASSHHSLFPHAVLRFDSFRCPQDCAAFALSILSVAAICVLDVPD